MSVYFALSPDNLVKIGFSEKPLERINSLRCGNGTPLRLMAVIDGDMADERRCHMRFGQYYSHGEWFFHKGKLRTFLKSQPLPPQPDYRPIGNSNQMHEADIQLLTERLQNLYGWDHAVARTHVIKMGPLKDHKSKGALYAAFGRTGSPLGRRPKDFAAVERAALPPIKIKSPRSKHGFVYFMRINGRGHVKIGYASDVKSRLSGHGTSTPGKPVLVGSMHGTMATEKRLHRKYSDLWVKGEWFKYTGALKAFVEALPETDLK